MQLRTLLLFVCRSLSSIGRGDYSTTSTSRSCCFSCCRCCFSCCSLPSQRTTIAAGGGAAAVVCVALCASSATPQFALPLLLFLLNPSTDSFPSKAIFTKERGGANLTKCDGVVVHIILRRSSSSSPS